MIAQHARWRARWASSSTSRSGCSTGWAPRTNDGTARVGPGELAGESIPMRLAHRAARRVRRGRASIRRRRRREARGGEPVGDAVRPRSRAAALCRRESPRRARLGGLVGRGSRRGAVPGDRAHRGRVDAALLAIANFVDLKSPYTLGHSPRGRRPRRDCRVAARPLDRRGAIALPRRSRPRLRSARRLERDLGQEGAARRGEWERVRMYPYYGERMLQQSETLAPLALIAVQHRERLDGSGYPRGLRAARSRARQCRHAFVPTVFGEEISDMFDVRPGL